MKTIYTAAILTLAASVTATVAQGRSIISTDNVSVAATDGFLHLSADIVLDSLRLKSNHQVFLTPMLEGGLDSIVRLPLPSVLINGRNMHVAYERGSLKGFEDIKKHDILFEVGRKNGKEQKAEYVTRVPMENWMRVAGTKIVWVYDSCGCGIEYATRIPGETPFDINPAEEMHTDIMEPAKTEDIVEIHEGNARVQFEVDKTVLHPGPYTCRNGQRIDNTDQLKMIDDSVKYALTDPNVEIAGIDICGYASPESPYLHNDYLATNRSRALAEYLADRYHLPRQVCTFSAVPENWKEFREQVVESKEITEKERTDLLELIDRPAYGPSDYDAKEKELETSPKFAKLYRTKIRPEWFPHLRATTFYIKTRLKPLSDRQLEGVLHSTPKKMTAEQMFRVARLYPEGSPKFNEAIDITLQNYPDDETAIANAASVAITNRDYKKARELAERLGDNPRAYNILGIIATREGNFEKAREYFLKAEGIPEAKKNLELLKF